MKLNQMQRAGEMNNSLGPAFAAMLVNTCHDITEGQWLCFGPDFAVGDWLNFHNAIVLQPWKHEACHPQN
jgi:hypothetical protein